MPAPSPSTNPSRVTSEGREAPAGSSLRVESACMDANAAIGSGWIAASEPPQSTMSARPERIIWVPAAIASAPDAHAETGACAPARAPNSIETYAAGEFAISIGTVIGSTRRAPLDFMTSHASSRVQIPPIPDATTVPSRSPSTSGEPASAQAWRAAIIAYCAEGSIRFISGRVSTSADGTASWPANVTAISYFSAQSFSSVRTPDRPASAACHVDLTSPPSGVVAPKPVTTTVGVLLIWNSRDQAQIGRPHIAGRPIRGLVGRRVSALRVRDERDGVADGV